MKKLNYFAIITLILSCSLTYAQEFEWVNNIGGTLGGEGNAIEVDSEGNTYITGQFFETADFDPSTATADLPSLGTAKDIFLAKYNSS